MHVCLYECMYLLFIIHIKPMHSLDLAANEREALKTANDKIHDYPADFKYNNQQNQFVLMTY